MRILDVTHFVYFRDELPEILKELKNKKNYFLVIKPAKHPTEVDIGLTRFSNLPSRFRTGRCRIPDNNFLKDICTLLSEGRAKWYIKFPYLVILDFGEFVNAEGLEFAYGVKLANDIIRN